MDTEMSEMSLFGTINHESLGMLLIRIGFLNLKKIRKNRIILFVLFSLQLHT